MKYIIASDIHGSAYFCNKLIERFEKEGASKLLLLGDLLYHGPRNDLPKEHGPKSVIEQLNAMKDQIVCCRGNCDAEVDQMVLDFPIQADYCMFRVGERMMFLSHGHVYNEQRLPPLSKGDILLNGHTHIPACRTYPDYTYMNPGSVSLPKGGSTNSYILVTEEEGEPVSLKFEWKTLDGEVFRTKVI